MAADLDDIDSLKKAFRGAYGVFGVTGMYLLILYDPCRELKSLTHSVDCRPPESIRH